MEKILTFNKDIELRSTLVLTEMGMWSVGNMWYMLGNSILIACALRAKTKEVTDIFIRKTISDLIEQRMTEYTNGGM